MNFHLPGVIVVLCLAAGHAAGQLEDEYHDPFNTGSRQWRLAFRGTAYIGKSALAAYNDGSSIPQFVEDACRKFDSGVPCRNHYRNYYVLDKWANIQEVLFAVYDRGQVVKHIVFDGVGTDYKNWFDLGRVKSTSWSDVQTEPHNFFSLDGDDKYDRRFFISRSYGGCLQDHGWFVASEDKNNEFCAWENHEKWPIFLYAPGDGYSRWNADMVNLSQADAFGIFVRYDTSIIVG